MGQTGRIYDMTKTTFLGHIKMRKNRGNQERDENNNIIYIYNIIIE